MIVRPRPASNNEPTFSVSGDDAIVLRAEFKTDDIVIFHPLKNHPKVVDKTFSDKYNFGLGKSSTFIKFHLKFSYILPVVLQYLYY